MSQIETGQNGHHVISRADDAVMAQITRMQLKNEGRDIYELASPRVIGIWEQQYRSASYYLTVTEPPAQFGQEEQLSRYNQRLAEQDEAKRVLFPGNRDVLRRVDREVRDQVRAEQLGRLQGR